MEVWFSLRVPDSKITPKVCMDTLVWVTGRSKPLALKVLVETILEILIFCAISLAKVSGLLSTKEG